MKTYPETCNRKKERKSNFYYSIILISASLSHTSTDALPPHEIQQGPCRVRAMQITPMCCMWGTQTKPKSHNCKILWPDTAALESTDILKATGMQPKASGSEKPFYSSGTKIIAKFSKVCNIE